MAQKTDAELTTEANVIGDETTAGANTADRVRDMLVDLIDSKTNNTDVDIAGHVIEDEGTPLTQRTDLNFTGNGVSAADSGGKTIVTIPSAPETALGNYSVNVNPYANGDTIQVFADKTKVQVENTADISTAPILGDVTGTLGASVVEKIQGIQVHTTDPTNGQVLKYVSANSRYEPASPVGTRVDWSGSIAPVGFASTSVLIAQYVDNGVIVTLHWYITGVTTTSNTTFTFTLPVAPNAAYTSGGYFQPIYALSNVTGSVGFIALSGGSTTATLYTSVALGAWSGTAGHAKGSRGTILYFK